jgi:hypothetical protein
MRNWLRRAIRPEISGRALRVAMIVGPTLTIINQGDVILNGDITAGVVGKIVLTFFVPYCVSTYAGVAALADQRNSQK